MHLWNTCTPKYDKKVNNFLLRGVTRTFCPRYWLSVWTIKPALCLQPHETPYSIILYIVLNSENAGLYQHALHVVKPCLMLLNTSGYNYHMSIKIIRTDIELCSARYQLMLWSTFELFRFVYKNGRYNFLTTNCPSGKT